MTTVFSLDDLDLSQLPTASSKRRGTAGTAPVSKETLDQEIESSQRHLMEMQLRRKMLDSPPELQGKLNRLQQLQRQINEGHRWETNENGRVENEIKALMEQTESLQKTLNDVKARLDKLSADNGRTYGKEMQDAAYDELKPLRQEIERELADKKLPFNVDEVLQLVQ